jgi:hypothetical protein
MSQIGTKSYEKFPLCNSKSVVKTQVSLHNYESNQQDATIHVNLLFLLSSTCFGRCFRPSSGALALYLQYLVVFTQVDERILPDTVNTVKCSL